MSANMSPSKQRRNVMTTPLSMLAGVNVAIDCLTPSCGGRRAFAAEELARWPPPGRTVAKALRTMRCSKCGKGPAAAWLENRSNGRVMQLLGSHMQVR